jgi:outer membrane protein TolC
VKAGAARAQARAGAKQGMPKLGGGFEYIGTAKRPEMDFPDNGKDAYMPMFTLSIPIYRKKYKAVVSEARHSETSYLAMHADAENEIAAEFQKTSFDRLSASERIRLYEKQISQTKQIVDLVLNRYENAESNFEEVLRLQQNLLQFEMNKVSELRNLRSAEAKLRYLVAQDIMP